MPTGRLVFLPAGQQDNDMRGGTVSCLNRKPSCSLALHDRGQLMIIAKRDYRWTEREDANYALTTVCLWSVIGVTLITLILWAALGGELAL
jgi:hypothetical protein